MKGALLAALLGAAAAFVGWRWQAMPYVLRAPGYPADQAVLAHRTSAYSDITWVGAPGDNNLELRFFNRVEGGVCLSPSWPDLLRLAEADPRLGHLVGDVAAFPAMPPAAAWPTGRAGFQPDHWPDPPSPGTLTHTKYITLFPVGVLLNRRLMDAAGGELRKASARVLVVGLGSGVGIATLAHHLPDAAIIVVDIDGEVVQAVLDHYPLLRWLTTQKTSTGEPRLSMVVEDARTHLHYARGREAAAGRPLDLLIFDAYTSGSTIPPHLMTVEFFATCARALAPDGVFMANIIGSYKGPKRKVLGGAIRSLRHRDCGLEHLRSIPVLQPSHLLESWDRGETRNNVVVASRTPFDAQAWKRAERHVPYEELKPDVYVTEQVYPSALPANDWRVWFASTGSHVAWPIDAATEALREAFATASVPDGQRHFQVRTTEDRQVIQKLRAALHAKPYDDRFAGPVGWDDDITCLVLRRIDWVAHARETYQRALAAGRDLQNDGEALVGPVDGGDAPRGKPTWVIGDAPLFTDARPNADIFNAE